MGFGDALSAIGNTFWTRTVWAVGFKDSSAIELSALYRSRRQAQRHADDGDDQLLFVSAFPVRVRGRYRPGRN